MFDGLNTAIYEVELRLDGKLIGDIRQLAENLTWTRQRTRMGVDSISFSLDDVLFADWCQMRATTISDVLRPLALDCRILRNRVPIVGGYLATMPSYQPGQTSAKLALTFDGYLNYLAGVYLYPQSIDHGKMGALIKQWITEADNRAKTAGKAFGFTAGKISDMAIVDQSIDNYTAVKDLIADRCDNISGAGQFDVYFHPDRTYDVIKDNEFGEEITDYIIQYPTELNGVAATSISAPEVSGFASTLIGIGSGEVAVSGAEDTAITSIQTNSTAVKRYGYAEATTQFSSVSVQETLDRNVAAELNNRSTMVWQPQLTLSGRQVSPMPSGERKIWLGDTITLHNSQDFTGMTSGKFRVNSLEVKVDSNGAEEVKPTVSRGDAINNSSFFTDYVRIQKEILALKTAR